MSFRIKRAAVTDPQTCPGIRDFIRPTMKYVKCHSCGGSVEIWSDEETGLCLDCGVEWQRPDKEASCLDYCEYADQCREIIASKRH